MIKLDEKNTYEVKGRIWIEFQNRTFIGKGKARLLKKTTELGSLRKAAIEMNISYRKAWYHLNQMNTATDTPLIILKRGGKQGGVAQITEFGKKMLEDFKNLEKEFADFCATKTSIFNS